MSLWESILASLNPQGRFLYGRSSSVHLAQLGEASCFGGELEKLRGRSVLILVRNQLAASLALIELDGIARRMVLCPPGVPNEYLAQIARAGEIDLWIGDEDTAAVGQICTCPYMEIEDLSPRSIQRHASEKTEWVLLTSGTTGVPKLVLHTLASLSSGFSTRTSQSPDTLWSTFYDIRRYGGLQILLRGLHAGSFVLSSPGESVTEFLSRAGGRGVTHISGTPSHWRKALMSGATSSISPRYVRLSGEIADQAILDALQRAYPDARVVHAFATTEAGLGFEVHDGRAGFPEALVTAGARGVEIDVSDGTLRLRSNGNAMCYLGANTVPLRSTDGFVNTGDRLELRTGRFHFVGRSGGVINVGGLKVYPEEVEAVINGHPWVHVSRVSPRKSPITGALVTAEVVVIGGNNANGPPPAPDELRQEIIGLCRVALSAHKVPVMIKFVESLETSEAGKLARINA